MGMGIYSSGASGEEKELEEKKEMEARLQAGKDRFNQMMANRSQNPVLGQTQSGMSGFDKFQAMQAARGVAIDSYNNSKLDGFNSSGAIGGLVNQSNAAGNLFTNTAVNQQPGYDKFQAMQAARDSVNSTYGQKIGMEALSKAMAAKGDPKGIWLKATQNYRNRNSGQPAGYDRFQAQTEANPLILQQLQQQQMGQRQMGPQFNAFGFGAQPGLNAQGGQGGQYACEYI